MRAWDARNGLFPNANLALSLVAAICLAWLSVWEHKRSIYSPDLVVLYLLSSSLLDTVWLALPSYLGKPLDLVLGLIIKITLVFLECRSKEPVLVGAYKHLPAEESANLLSRTLFWWIHPILAQGYRNVLLSHELPAIERDLGSSPLRKRMIDAWKQPGMPSNRLASCAGN